MESSSILQLMASSISRVMNSSPAIFEPHRQATDGTLFVVHIGLHAAAPILSACPKEHPSYQFADHLLSPYCNKAMTTGIMESCPTTMKAMSRHLIRSLPAQCGGWQGLPCLLHFRSRFPERDHLAGEGVGDCYPRPASCSSARALIRYSNHTPFQTLVFRRRFHTRPRFCVQSKAPCVAVIAHSTSVHHRFHRHCGSPLKKRSTANAARAEMPRASPPGSGTGATGGTSQKFDIVQAGA
jgi:hypothetical protein